MTAADARADRPAGDNGNGNGQGPAPRAIDVFRNRPFLLLWLSQLFTQVGGNMVMYALMVVIQLATSSSSAVALLILTFLGPAVLFSAVAGVFVDRIDRRMILVITNVLRGLAIIAIFLVGSFLPAILVLSTALSTITVFFAPAEAAMIPVVVPRSQLISANGVFTLTLNAAFAIGFALLGPLFGALFGPEGVVAVVAGCYLVAAAFCWTLPPAPPGLLTAGAMAEMVGESAAEVGSTFAEFREGIRFIRDTPKVRWSLVYLGIAASLVGVLAVVGTTFLQKVLELDPNNLIVIILPLGFGIVTGILLLNNFGHLLPRRRIIEAGLIALGILLALLAVVVPVARFLQGAANQVGIEALQNLTSVLGIVEAIALVAGVAYALVAIPSQTQLQEDIPAETRGRVFGILNMLVSAASFLPLLVAALLLDVVGTTNTVLLVAALLVGTGVTSIVRRGPLNPDEERAHAIGPSTGVGLDPLAVANAAEVGEAAAERRAARAAARAIASAAALDAKGQHLHDGVAPAGSGEADTPPPAQATPAAGDDAAEAPVTPPEQPTR
ncbi:MAG: MFS transporter [Candidatus Limnocylindrales bacterium]